MGEAYELPPPMRPDVSRYTFMQAFVDNTISSLPNAIKSALAMNLVELAKPRQSTGSDNPGLVITLGTVCSGSEVYMSSLRHLSASLLEHLGIILVFDHLWCFEWDELKRAWIVSNFLPGRASETLQGFRRRAWPSTTRATVLRKLSL